MVPLQILLLEDLDDDAELIDRTIARAGIAAVVKHVRSEFTYLNALQHEQFDIILVDFALPRFDGISAVRAARLCHPDVPVILISGVIGEDLAAETLTIGASDFVLKDRLERLAPVIQRWAPQSDATRQNG
jgi:CheY-like chemotaxis protein